MIRNGGLARHLWHPPVLPAPFSTALGPALPPRHPGAVVGLEQEYSLRRAGNRLDFRGLIHGLAIAGRRLDPGDLNAYRCPSGLVITCDAEDAEVVSPPLDVRPGVAGAVQTWAEHGRDELSRLLPADISVIPFSTHLSASTPDDVVVAASDLFARAFAPALMLMLDRPDSHGVFVRPRPGRLEVCGEHATGSRLGAAAVLVAGGARSCAAAVAHDRGTPVRLPPTLAVNLRPATGRPGLFVGRQVAFGYDLYAAGRHAVLPLHAGGTIGAQAYLLSAWEAAGDALGGDIGQADLAAGDAMILGSAPLGVEQRESEPGMAPGSSPSMAGSPFGDLLERRVRTGFEVTPAAATWDFTVFRLAGPAREGYASVPGAQLRAFLDRLDAGLLDGLFGTFLEGAPTGSVLLAHEQTTVPALWDRAVIGPDLLPYERSARESAPPAFDPRPPPMSYVRRGKAAAILSQLPTPLVPPAPLAPPPAPPPPAPPTPTTPPPVTPPVTPPAVIPPPEPLGSPLPSLRPARRRRRRARVLVVGVLTLFVAGAAAALTAGIGGREQDKVAILTSPAAPVAQGNTAQLTTDSTQPPPAESDPTVPAQTPPATEPPAIEPSAPTTAQAIAPTTRAASPRPTTADALPVTTITNQPNETTVPVETTVAATTTTATTVTTTTSLTPPTSFVVGVASGALGCVFQPSSASAVAGSTVRFRNDTGSRVSVSVIPPAGDTMTIALDAGGSSGGVSLAALGSYPITCDSGRDSAVGRMTITVTNG